MPWNFIIRFSGPTGIFPLCSLSSACWNPLAPLLAISRPVTACLPLFRSLLGSLLLQWVTVSAAAAVVPAIQCITFTFILRWMVLQLCAEFWTRDRYHLRPRRHHLRIRQSLLPVRSLKCTIRLTHGIMPLITDDTVLCLVAYA